eukprot:114553-Prymnesium_polylepis.1
MSEPFPDLLEPESYYNTFVLRQLGSSTEGVEYEASLAVHTRLYQKFSVWTSKMLHQGRRQAQQEMDEDDVGIDDNKRMAHYQLHTEQVLSYLLNLPLHAIAQRCGLDHKNMSDVEVAHLDCDPDHALIDL